jgi:hypothetical protein
MGANCINLLFCNTPKYILYLSNDTNRGETMYNYISSTVNSCEFKYQVLRYNGINIDPLNSMNNSFTVDIDEVLNNIKKNI